MRITEKLIFSNAKVHTTQNRARMEQAMREVSTGRRVVHPWDDPVAAGRIAFHKNQESQWQGLLKGADRSISELQSADDALDNIQQAVQRAYELAIQLENDTYSASDRQSGAIEMDTLKDEVTYFLNTAVGGRYVFGGISDDIPPFDSNGIFQGSTIQRVSEIAPGLTTESSIDVSKYITSASGGIDVPGALESLKIAFQNSDSAGINVGIAELKSCIQQVANARAEAGTQQQFFEIAADTGLYLRDQEHTRASELGDADIIDAATRLQISERSLEASLTASVKSFRLTLLDKM
jgi:flagellar hook-associated protein 3 FlgL